MVIWCTVIIFFGRSAFFGKSEKVIFRTSCFSKQKVKKRKKRTRSSNKKKKEKGKKENKWNISESLIKKSIAKLDYDGKKSTEKTRAWRARILARIPQARIPRPFHLEEASK